MALYIGKGEKVKITTGNGVFNVKCVYIKPNVNNIKLMSKDNYLLTDLNGLYLTAKEDK